MGGRNGEVVNEISTMFNEAQSDCAITPLSKGTYEEALSSGIAAFRSGEQPNILQVFDAGAATIISAKGATIPAEDLIVNAGGAFNRDDFIAGVRALPDYGLSFDMCIKHRQLQASIALADACPKTMIVLDHIAKPGIKAGLMQPWADQMFDMAKRDNVVCKLSGVATEAAADWTAETLRPYLDVALDAFGPNRLMFGGDWPVSTLAITYPAWVEIVDQLIADLSSDEQRQIYCNTARQFYRLA